MTTLPVTHAVYGRGTATSIVTAGVRKIHTTFQQGTEMIEEFDMSTELLKSRRVRQKSELGAQGPWKFEVGDPVQSFNPSTDTISPSPSNPTFSRHDSPHSYIFRIRNLPYPPSTYLLSVTPSHIIVRTTNKKFYKEIPIPDITTTLSPSLHPPSHHLLTHDAMRWEWTNNTLVIWYTKPDWILDREAQERVDRKQLHPLPMSLT